VHRLVIGDNTAKMNASLFDAYGELVQPGDVIRLTGGYCDMWQQAMTLYAGKLGKIERVGEFCFPFTDRLDGSDNMSKMQWVQQDKGAWSAPFPARAALRAAHAGGDAGGRRGGAGFQSRTSQGPLDVSPWHKYRRHVILGNRPQHCLGCKPLCAARRGALRRARPGGGGGGRPPSCEYAGGGGCGPSRGAPITHCNIISDVTKTKPKTRATPHTHAAAPLGPFPRACAHAATLVFFFLSACTRFCKKLEKPSPTCAQPYLPSETHRTQQRTCKTAS
jgi:hypothetical protein